MKDAVQLQGLPVGYGAGIGASAIAALLAVTFYDFFQPTPFLPFFAAVAFSAWAGGLGPGLLATLLGGVVGTYLFLPPSFSIALEGPATVIRLGGFALVGALISSLSARLRTTRTRAVMATRRAKDSEERVAAILNGVGEGITVLDVSGRLIYANDAAAALCGYCSAAELMAAPSADILRRFALFDAAGEPFPAERLPGRRALHGEAAPEALIQFEVLASRERRWSLVSATAIPDKQGRVALAVSCFRDITERRHAEEAARFLAAASRELAGSLDYEATLRQVADLAVPTLSDWCIVDIVEELHVRRVAVAYADPAKRDLAEEIKRRAPADLVATTGVAQVLRTGRAEVVPLLTAEALEAAVPDLADRQMLQAMPMRSFVIAPMLARGNILGAISFIASASVRHYGPAELELVQDLADRAALAVDNARLYREAQQQTAAHVALNTALSQAVQERTDAVARVEGVLRTRDEFLATAAHDLKNPLTGIKATVQLLGKRLRTRAPDPKAMAEALERIDATATRANELVDELLDLTRLQMRRPLDLDRQPVDLVALVRAAVAEQQPLAERHELEVEAVEPALIGAWDARRLRRLVTNLLDNAIKYSPDGGPIAIRVARTLESQGDWATLTVRDRGIGIPAEDLPRLFERFHRGSNVTGRIAGTGVGLASVRQIVESHGGEVAVSSNEVDGTTLEVRLPLQVAVADAPGSAALSQDVRE